MPTAICCRGVPCSGVILGVNKKIRNVDGMSVCVGQGEGLHELMVNQGTASSWKLTNPGLKLFRANLVSPGRICEVCTTSFCQNSLPVSPVPLGQPLNCLFLLLAVLSRGCTVGNGSNLTATVKEFCL